MVKNLKNPKVDEFFNSPDRWQKEFKKLRQIVLSFDLSEDFKWKHPCYSLDNNNVVLIHGFKDYCALLFFKGALMKDPQHILIQQTENVQVSRQIRFTSVKEISEMEAVIKAYIKQAIKVEKAGLKAEMKTTSDFAIPDELQYKFDEMPRLRSAFESLTPGRQRGYLLYFSAPIQSKTRESRIENYVDRILDGIGLNDEFTSKKKK